MSRVPALTPLAKSTGLTLNYVYTSYRDVCNQEFLVLANNSGVVVDSSLSTVPVLNAFNAVNNLFVASDVSSNYVSANRDYLDYYTDNNFVKASSDLTVSTGTASPAGSGITVDASANSIAFARSSILTTAKSTKSVDVSATLVANMPFYKVNNKSVSNNIKVSTHPIGISCASRNQLINAPKTSVAKKSFEFIVASASTTAYLKIENDMQSVNSYINGGVWPKVDASIAPILLNNSIPVKQGYNTQLIEFEVPVNQVGVWFWNVTLFDKNVAISSPVSLQVSLVPTYSQPVISFDKATYAVSKDVSNVDLKLQYANDDYTLDISNFPLTAGGLKYDFRMYPNNVTTAVLADVNNFTLKSNGANLLNDVKDVSNGVRLVTELGEQLSRVDLSTNDESVFFKNSDVSKSYVLNYTGASEHLLVNRSYTLAMDWSNRNNSTLATNLVSTNVATININPTFSSNASVSDLLNGNYRLSYSQTPMPEDSRFHVDYLDASGNKIVSSSALRPDVSSNTGMSLDISVNFAMFSTVKPSAFVAYVGTTTNAHLYTKSASAQSVSSVLVPGINVVTLTGAGKTFEQINVNDVAMLAEGFDPNDPNLQIISQLEDKDLSGFYVRDFDLGVDITASLDLPLWFKDIQNPQIVFTIIDNNQCMSKFDVCCNTGMVSSTGTTTKTAIITDISSYRNMNLDITFNPTSAPTTFQFSYSFTGVLNGSARTFGSNIFVYYVPESQEYTAQNAGKYINYVFIHNNCKLSLDNTNSSLGLQGVDSCLNHVWRNLATSVNNLYNINLSRNDFYPSAKTSHQFIYKDISINATSYSNNSQKPKVLFSFSKAARDVNTAAACNSQLDSGFSNLPYTFIQLNAFIGHIDIVYNTMKDGLKSVVPNKLRLIVLPRPSVDLKIADQSANLLPKSQNVFNYTVANMQYNGTSPLEYNTSVTYSKEGQTLLSDLTDASFNSSINSKIVSYNKITNGVITIAPLPNLFDVSQNNMTTIGYGLVGAAGTITFKGLDTSVNRILDEVVTARFNFIGSSNLLTVTKPLVITIVTNNGNTLSNCVYANCVTAYKSIEINNIEFVKYVIVDGLTPDYQLDSSFNSTAVWVFVQNVSIANRPVAVKVGTSPFTVTSAAGTTVPLVITPGSRAGFMRLSSTNWSYFGTI